MLLKLIQEAASSRIAVTFDLGRETFRLALYPEYKANRRECPEDLVPQMPYFKHIVEALGLPVLSLPGYEADDVIGTVAKRLADHGEPVVVVSGDKDLLQLVGPHVTVWDTMHDRRFSAAEVKERFGVSPDKVVEVLALMGDSSDNIPGLAGAGPKTATQLIERYGSVEGVLRSIDAIEADASIRNRAKLAKTLREQQEVVRLSRTLVQIARDAPLELHTGTDAVHIESLSLEGLKQALTRRPPEVEILRELCARLNFTSLLEEISATALDRAEVRSAEAPGAEQVDLYRTIYAREFEEWVRNLKGQKCIAFDTETTSLDVRQASLVGVSVCWSSDEAFYIPLGHLHSPEPQVSLDQFISATRVVWEDERIGKIGQNLKYDVQVLSQVGLYVKGLAFDTMVAAYLLNPDKGSFNLTALAEEFLGTARLTDGRVIEFEEVLGEGTTFADVEVEPATRYACQDAHYAWMLSEVLGRLLEQEGLMPVFRELEMPLVSVIARMELHGIRLDTAFLGRMSAEFSDLIERLRRQIFEMAGGEFNVNSPKQLSEVLFEKLGIPSKGLKRTKTGISTDSSVLERLSLLHPLPAVLLKYRMLHKLKSTYIDALPVQVSPITGRLHTRFNQTGTGTGRLSSSDPNLQNIPIQTAEGARVREAFIAEPGWTLISADYSQIELRLLAHLSNDETLIQAFRDEVDIHAQTARELLQIEGEVSPEQRRLGKTMNFGIIYGMSGFRLARELGISVGEADQYIADYFRRFPGVRNYFDELERQAAGEGFVRTIMGRKRVISSIDQEGRDRGFAARVAVNAPIQGSAADVIKKAMVDIDRMLLSNSMDMRLLLQIHDELVLECKQAILEEGSRLVRTRMEQVMPLRVPLKVELGSGINWHLAH
jgi:DNA polymerase-1